MGTIAVIAAASLALVFFVAVVDLVVVQYARGVAQMAVDEAVRTASSNGTPDGLCREVGAAVLADLLGGPVGVDLAIDCDVDAGAITARVSGVVRTLGPLVPDLPIEAGAVAVVG